MSFGFTGLKMNFRAMRQCNYVLITYHESFEHFDSISAYERRGKTLTFPSVFRAQLFAERINDGQIRRYRGMQLI